MLGVEEGYETPNLAVIGEQDILGDRLVRPRRKARRAADLITEATSLAIGDFVVHADHGIGRFDGLTTITALGAPHDCLEIAYAGGDKLYLPVENIELLTRYGSGDGVAQLDRLGGAAWQSRKARLKQRLREIASELIKIAALRQLREAPVLVPPQVEYDEFVARFPYDETDDQAASIQAVLDDLASGKPMDRLVCGDVGFGKTEVALRAAFIAAFSGLQVAVVVPTTLLARQHFATFNQRFKGLPVRIAQASRLVGGKDLQAAKASLAEGTTDIIVGTHALLGKSITFNRLGLLVVDEEQHFGVAHKERLKHLREEVHVLTLTATPIPRTLQLALSGVRELSLISTPPVDRLAVRTYISPFDPVIIREALRRERYRGGQSFYVVPRIADLDEVREFLAEQTPELKVATAHGQLSPGALEDVMTAFYDGKYDVLLSTAIVESGLDIPNANTLIVHRADMFGLAQLYQLRGRVGRSKPRAYAYFTTPNGQRLSEGAEKRLKVLQSLDTLGAGFSLASHDLDIRGGGNLLGEEQSGHIREVGFELYQSMLEEAVAALKGGDVGEAQDQWSPQISLGTSVLIPDSYVADLQLRLGLYRRLSTLELRPDIDAFAAEMVDRFGELPDEVKHLLDVVEIKGLAKLAGLQQVDAGPKGAVIAFRKNQFANPEGLVAFMQKSRGGVRMQPDHKLVFKADWDLPEARLAGVRGLVRQLAEIAGQAKEGGVGWVKRSADPPCPRRDIPASSLSLRPPRVHIESAQRQGRRELEGAAMRHPHLGQVEQGNRIVARDQHAVERAHGRGEILLGVGLQHGFDHGVGRRVLDAGEVQRAFDVGRFAAPAIDLLVAGRERGCPVPLHHVEVETLQAHVVLGAVHLAYAQFDAEPVEGARIAEQQAFLRPRLREKFHAQAPAGLRHAAAFDLIARIQQQLVRGLQVAATVAIAFSDRLPVGPFQNLRFHEVQRTAPAARARVHPPAGRAKRDMSARRNSRCA